MRVGQANAPGKQSQPIGTVTFTQPQQIDVTGAVGVFVDGQRLRVLTPGHIGTGEAGTLRRLVGWGEREIEQRQAAREGQR